MSCKTLAQDITQAINTGTTTSSDLFVFARNSQVYSIAFSSLLVELGATGTITSIGSGESVSILNQPSAGINQIRSIEPSRGITATTGAEGGIEIKTNLANDPTGFGLIKDTTANQIVFKSIVGGVNTSIDDDGDSLTINVESASPFSKQVVVRDASDFDSPIDSTVQYLIDGDVNMGATQITIPSGGINLAGYNFSVSKLYSESAAYTMFVGATSGNFIAKDMSFGASGSGSAVFGMTASTGFEAIEVLSCNFIDCDSLGTITGYRQYFETGTGRFGGKPSLTFDGTWLGGARVAESIVRQLDSGMTEPLFKAGNTLSFSSRFLTDVNCDLPASAALLDFDGTEFVNDTTLQLNGAIITRNGATDPDDSNITPNIDHTSEKSLWKDNIGVKNTRAGGAVVISSSSATTLALDTYAPVSGTFSLQNAQHFDSPLNGQLRHTVDVPRSFNGYMVGECTGTSNDLIRLRIMQYDASAATASEVASQLRQINSSTGGSNTAQFALFAPIEAAEGDYFYLEVKNETAANNVTFSVDTSLAVSI